MTHGPFIHILPWLRPEHSGPAAQQRWLLLLGLGMGLRVFCGLFRKPMDTLIVLGSDGLTFRGEVGGLVDWLPFLTKLY